MENPQALDVAEAELPLLSQTCHGRAGAAERREPIARLLSTLANSDRIAFALTVTHRDRPDSFIQFGSQRIGLEIAEAVSMQYAAYCALAEREFPNVFIEPTHFRWGSPSLSAEEMRTLLRHSQLTCDGWAGDRPEQEWALFIQSTTYVAGDRKLTHWGCG